MLIEPKKFFFEAKVAPADLFQNPNIPTPDEIAAEMMLCRFSHWDFGTDRLAPILVNQQRRIGELVINRAGVPDIKLMLDLAYNIMFPFDEWCAVSKYNFDDVEACKANASTGHNMRNFQLAYSKELSKHGTGMAFDINPMLNPCWDIDRENPLLVHPTYPPGASYFPERIGSLYKVHPIVVLMEGLGWAWGGGWGQPEDRMHFQKVIPAHEKYYG